MLLKVTTLKKWLEITDQLLKNMSKPQGSDFFYLF